MMSTLAGYATVYRPEDMYVGTRLAALTAIDSGITTMLDFSHNSRTREHSDAAIEALRDTGIRGVHASMGPHFGDWDRQWPGDLTRLKDQYFTSDDQLLTLRMAALATDEIAGPALAYGSELARTRSDLGIGVSVDAVFGTSSSEAVLRWAERRHPRPRRHPHPRHRTDHRGVEGDRGERHHRSPSRPPRTPRSAWRPRSPPSTRRSSVGIRPGLSIDVEVALASDMFTQMRALHAIQRMRAVNAVYGTAADRSRITTHDVLDFATLQGARTNGLADVTGSLTPGKKADLLVVQAEDLNNMPLNDPIGTLVLGSDARNISAVLIDGEPRKWNGQVLDVDLAALRREVSASRRYVLNTPAA